MNLEQEILTLKTRNQKVETEKAWEISWTRKIGILILTYIVILIFLSVLHFEKPFISALVPTLGFFLSTLSLSFLKNFWKKRIYKK
jgi:Fe2+ transport system protein B